MKKMCILPSQIPLSYRNTSPTFNTSRRQEAAAAHQNRIDLEDVEEQGFVVEQNETEQLISEELPIDLVVHGNNNNGSDRNDNNSNSIISCHQQPTDFCCSNNSSEQYISYNNTGLRFGDGGEEAETSLIPAVIRQSSLQRNPAHTSFSDIRNQDMITSDLTSSRSAAAAVNASSTSIATSSISTITNEATSTSAAAPAPPKPQPNSHQVEVTVCVNNHYQPTDS
ncbi:Hypothetical predicted protein [Octopus vulgaris]|uniref:Uncharacterized protein n=1 Tax=Octopus vulgaris TaxID=6645 RepID=A0AA36AJ63_OCTVU|nr:Hypothetical predicted protein [Octopus vulgaris]